MRVEIIKCLQDNYSYIIIDEKKQIACVVDPSEAQPIINFVEEKKIYLKYILNTHHHFDHIGGNIELKEKYDAKIVGSKNDKERIPGIDICLKEGEFFEFNGHKAEIIDIPGHTLGHIAFYIQSENIVFTGDTLFSLGCGRIFEGTPEMMFESLNKLKNLPDNTKVYCGHEYTLNNALFLESIIKDKDLSEMVKSLRELHEKQQPSIPTTIKAEKKLNFFLKSNEESFKNYLNMSKANDLEVFTYLRHLKDTF